MCKRDEDDSKGSNKIFQSRLQAFFLAVAIGMRDDETKASKNEKQLLRRDYLYRFSDFDVFQMILKNQYKLETEEEIVSKLIQFASYGIETLYNEYHKTGFIDFVSLSKSII